MRKFIYLISCVALGACGDDSGGSKPAPVPTLNVTLKPSVTSQTVPEADSTSSFVLEASYTGSTSDPIYPKLTYDKTVLALDGEMTRSGNGYTAKFKTLSGLSAKTYANTVSFQLCRDSDCTTVYPGSTQTFTHSLEVKLSDWTARQRNARHDGFVHATFDPSKFAKAWEVSPASATGFREAAAGRGMVFVTQTSSDRSTVALALDDASGAERWRYSLGNLSYASGPALSGGSVVFSTMFTSSGNNPLVVLNADTGQFTKNFIFASQWSVFAPPTPFENSIYISAGYYGNVVYGYDLNGDAELWTGNGSAGHTWDGEAPAADSRYVYYYSGNLDVFDRLTGERVKSITDPFWQWNGYSYGGTPMLGSDNHVIAYSGNGMGTYAISFPLVDYDIAAGAYRWRTANGYSVIPAVANGVVYAASNQTSQFDAIDEQTGKIQWSWPRPAGEQFVGNIVVTDTLVFLSTDAAVYAIATDGTHQTKWTAKTPGTLAVTPSAKLIITPIQGTSSPMKVTAYSLR